MRNAGKTVDASLLARPCARPTAGIEKSGIRCRHSPGSLRVKRSLDVALALPACVVLLPLIAVIAVAIKLDSPGPVFFVQPRRGKGFAPFRMVKFRSLCHRAPDPHENYEMLEEDPRITRVGRWLRSTSLDEAPQLFNVLTGTMSLVGPRPLVEWESQATLPEFAERYEMKPGVTGWSQVTVRNSVDFAARLRKDVEYVRNWSLALDLRILLRTPLTVLRATAIYPEP